MMINLSYVTLVVIIQISQFCSAEQKIVSTIRPGPTNAGLLLSSRSTTTKDEIYIDDEGIEGSGGRGEIHDDLEKEVENSGSGFGPDDEDSNHYNPSTDVDTKSIDSKNSDRRKNRIYDENHGHGSSVSNSGGKENVGPDPDQNVRKGISTDKSHETNKNALFNNEVLILDAKGEDRTASFFAQPGILAAVIGGAVVGLLCAILVVMFIVYRMRKKDEGSYALEEPKRSPAPNSYAKNGTNREFYA